MNRYTSITFDPATMSVLCLFSSGTPIKSIKHCNVTVAYGANCDQQIRVYSNSSINNLVLTPQIEFVNDIHEYCLFVNASSNNTTITVEGMLVDIGEYRL